MTHNQVPTKYDQRPPQGGLSDGVSVGAVTEEELDYWWKENQRLADEGWPHPTPEDA